MKNETESRSRQAAAARRYFGDKMAFTTGPIELNRQLQRGESITLIDVREPEDYQAGHIPGALNLPRDQWDTFAELDRDRLNVIYGYSVVCHLAAAAAVTFAEHGFPVKELDGGFRSWKEQDLPVESRQPAMT